MVRGGPVLHMAAASMQPMTEWGINSLQPLATSKVDTDAFCTSSFDNETVEQVSQPMSNVGREPTKLADMTTVVECTVGKTISNVLIHALDPRKW